MSLDVFKKLAEKQRREGGVKKRRSKYGNEHTGGHASKKEHGRALALASMQERGLISELREQVPFELIAAQHDTDGSVIERACRYVADFVYRDADGSLVVEDTKGFRTAEYKIKRKLMLAKYGIKIKEL